MIIVSPSVQIYEPKTQEELIKQIQFCGRIANQSAPEEERAASFVNRLVSGGELLTVLEHVNLTLILTCSRGTANQLVRHRIAAYTQESTRYNYLLGKSGTDLVLIKPVTLPEVICGRFTSMKEYKKQKHESNQVDDLFSASSAWVETMLEIETGYNNLCALTNQETARGVLPLDLKTTIAATMNIRQWRHVIKQRISLTCSPGMRELMGMVLLEVNDKYPLLFAKL